MLRLSLIISVLMMMGCNSYIVQPDVPASLIKPCPKLPILKDGKSHTLVRHLTRVYGQYHRCSAKQSALSGILTEDNKK